MSDPSAQIGDGSGAGHGPLVLAAALVIVGALSGWVGQSELAAVVGGGGAPEAVPAEVPTASGPDIFLVTIGNVRADHLPFYRYARSTAPWLTRVARRSQVFTAASAASSWSLPSVMSLMTGLLPSQHGIEEPPVATGTSVDLTTLAEGATTLAERLQPLGYETYAVVANPVLLSETGLGRGFDRFINLGFTRASRVQIGVERIASDVRRRDDPVFVWVHYGDPHDPYTVASPIVNAWENVTEAESGDLDAGVFRYARASLPELLTLPELRGPGPDLDHLTALYDSELRAVDEHIQLLYGDLGITDDDVVVIASDHGEEFRDHGELGHGRNLHEETVRVPLILSWPALWVEPHRIFERVSLVDLVPTLAEVAGAPVPDGELPARSLVPLVEGRDVVRDVPVVAELLRSDGVRCRAVYEGASNKVIAGSDGQAALYDLEQDPGEQADRAGDDPRRVRAVVRAVDAWTSGLPADPPYVHTAEVGPLLATQIQALGYAAPPPTACP